MKTVRKNEKWRLDYMTLQMNYQEKYEQGIEQGREQSNRQSALRMIKAGKLSNDEIALYSGLTTEQVEALEEMFQVKWRHFLNLIAVSKTAIKLSPKPTHLTYFSCNLQIN